MTLAATPSDTIAELKIKIVEQRTSIPVSWLHFQITGQELENTASLRYYNILTGATVYAHIFETDPHISASSEGMGTQPDPPANDDE